MNQLQKIGAWIWLNKERMVVVVMVAILCYRVYVVLYPSDEISDVMPVTVTNEIPEDQLPESPTSRPAMDTRGNYAKLYRDNPFHYDPDTGRDGDGDAADAGLSLRRIQQVGGVWKAQIYVRATGTRNFYEEGEQFEKYRVDSIDPDEQTATVFSSELGKSITLRVGR